MSAFTERARCISVKIALLRYVWEPGQVWRYIPWALLAAAVAVAANAAAAAAAADIVLARITASSGRRRLLPEGIAESFDAYAQKPLKLRQNTF